MSSEPSKTDDDKPYLLAVLKETQDTVRSFDTKAQIVGIGFILTMGILKGFFERMGGPVDVSLFSVVMAWLVAIGPIVLFGSVLYPSRGKMESSNVEGHDIRHAFYLGSDLKRDFHEYLEDITSSDWREELVFELVKTSRIREIKRRRFILALTVSCMSLLIMALHQVTKALNFS
jgi:hypothetical protein